MSKASKGKCTEQLKTHGKELIPGGILSVAAAFMFCIYAPIELYCNNKGEFWFDMGTLLPVLLVMFLVVFGVSAFLLFLLFCIHRNAYKIGLAGYLIAYLASYIQGNYLVKNLPPLDGTQVDWSLYGTQRIVTVVLWLVIITGVVLAVHFAGYERFLMIAKVAGLFITAILLVTLVSVVISKKGFEKKLNIYASTKQEYEFSENQNFIILVLDATDAKTFETMLATHPEYADTFSDFTFYKNTMSAYPFTMHDIPFLLSGDWYENDESFDDYNVNVYKNSELFSTLEDRGYKMGMYEDEVPLLDESMYRFVNIQEAGKLGLSEFLLFMKRELQLVGFRYAPFDLKRFCVVTGLSFQELRGIHYEYPAYYYSNKAFYDDLKNTSVTTTQDKWFKFIHIEGAHTPFRYDANVNVIENGSYESNMEATMTITHDYLEKLKENGVYDNSAIIVMADHGYEVNGETFGRQNPVLFVKGVGETHDTMQISDAPISFEDLQVAYTRLLDGQTGTDIFDYQEGDIRERRYLFYYYEKENHMVEYQTDGHAGDTDALQPTGQVYDRKED